MGKKEREIKKKINEYYYSDKPDKLIETNEEYTQRKIQEDIEKADNKLENVSLIILKTMKKYSEEQGLSLCEFLDIENIENFIKHTTSYKKKYNKAKPIPKQVTEDTSEKTTYEAISQDEIIMIESEIEEIKQNNIKYRNDFIILLGESKLQEEWNCFQKKTSVDEEWDVSSEMLPTLLIRKFGKTKYYNLVREKGEKIFNNIYKSPCLT